MRGNNVGEVVNETAGRDNTEEAVVVGSNVELVVGKTVEIVVDNTVESRQLVGCAGNLAVCPWRTENSPRPPQPPTPPIRLFLFSLPVSAPPVPPAS